MYVSVKQANISTIPIECSSQTTPVQIMHVLYLYGIIHNFQHFHKSKESTLFRYPLPPPQKSTIKNLMLIG